MYFRNSANSPPPWKRVEPFVRIQLDPLHPRMLCNKFGKNWPSGSGEDDFSNLLMYFRYFVIISPRKRKYPFISINLNHFTQGYFVPSFIEIGQLVLEKKILKSCQCIFAIFAIISSLKKEGPFI